MKCALLFDGEQPGEADVYWWTRYDVREEGRLRFGKIPQPEFELLWDNLSELGALSATNVVPWTSTEFVAIYIQDDDTENFVEGAPGAGESSFVANLADVLDQVLSEVTWVPEASRAPEYDDVYSQIVEEFRESRHSGEVQWPVDKSEWRHLQGQTPEDPGSDLDFSL